MPEPSLAELLALNEIRMMPSHGKKLGHADRIGPAPRAPLQDLFDYDEFTRRMAEPHQQQRFPVDALTKWVAGLPRPL